MGDDFKVVYYGFAERFQRRMTFNNDDDEKDNHRKSNNKVLQKMINHTKLNLFDHATVTGGDESQIQCVLKRYLTVDGDEGYVDKKNTIYKIMDDIENLKKDTLINNKLIEIDESFNVSLSITENDDH